MGNLLYKSCRVPCDCYRYSQDACAPCKSKSSESMYEALKSMGIKGDYVKLYLEDISVRMGANKIEFDKYILDGLLDCFNYITDLEVAVGMNCLDVRVRDGKGWVYGKIK